MRKSVRAELVEARGTVRLSTSSGRTVALLLVLCLPLAGCGQDWKKKFIRKRSKPAEQAQAVLVLQKDHQAMYAPDVRYKEHYAFWKSWHGELLISLGQIRKRDLRYLDSTIGELRSMQALLSGEPSERMREVLVELSDLRDRWDSTPEALQIPSSDRTRLERLQREISKKFHYSEIKDSIVPDPDPAEIPVEEPPKTAS